MKSTKTMVFIAAGPLVLGGLCFLPSVAGQGREKSLEQRVTILDAQVAELTARLDELEGGSCSCTKLNLQPQAKFPDSPSEGDLCVVWDEDLPGAACYRCRQFPIRIGTNEKPLLSTKLKSKSRGSVELEIFDSQSFSNVNSDNTLT